MRCLQNRNWDRSSYRWKGRRSRRSERSSRMLCTRRSDARRNGLAPSIRPRFGWGQASPEEILRVRSQRQGLIGRRPPRTGALAGVVRASLARLCVVRCSVTYQLHSSRIRKNSETASLPSLERFTRKGAKLAKKEGNRSRSSRKSHGSKERPPSWRG